MFESLFSQALFLLGLLLLGLLVWAAFSPFETLGWWAGWFGDKIYHDDLPSDGLVRSIRPNASCYILFLSGIGRVSGQTLSYREAEFLRRLSIALPNAVIIDDIFPYSVNNLPLTGQPFFARIWRWALRRKLDGPAMAGNIINIRNAFQVWVSADNRYGPIYNQGMAQIMLHGLLRYDYPVDSDIPVFIIGYSAGGQMAVGATTYLTEWINAPVYVLSLGGVFASDPGLFAAEHVYHFYGTKDKALPVAILVPRRWPVFATSEWNRARRQGRITDIEVGPMGHTGRGGYLDARATLEDGTPFVDKVVDDIAQVVKEIMAGRTTTLEMYRNTDALTWEETSQAAASSGSQDGQDMPAQGQPSGSGDPEERPDGADSASTAENVKRPT